MTKENPSNKVTIIVAIITSITSISVAIVTGFFGIRAIQTQKEVELTSLAMQVIATQGRETQAVLENMISTPSLIAPTPQSEITTQISPLFTNTPFLIPTYTITPSSTPETNMIFFDDFTNGISDRWKLYGTWIVSDGKPIVVQEYKSTNGISPFYLDPNPSHTGGAAFGGLILQEPSENDNFALEFDFYNCAGLRIILAFKDENSYKTITCSFGEFILAVVTDKQILYFPRSEGFNEKTTNHLRIEVRNVKLKLSVNDAQLLDIQSMPENLSGTIGIAAFGSQQPYFDNLKIYGLP